MGLSARICHDLFGQSRNYFIPNLGVHLEMVFAITVLMVGGHRKQWLVQYLLPHIVQFLKQPSAPLDHKQQNLLPIHLVLLA